MCDKNCGRNRIKLIKVHILTSAFYKETEGDDLNV